MNYYLGEKEPVHFNSKVVNNHHIIMNENSFCYITDASRIDEATQPIRGFGEVGFLDMEVTEAHDGMGYFYDVISAQAMSDKALQKYRMVKHDIYLYKRLGIEESPEEIEKKSYHDIWEIVNKYKDACFYASKKAEDKS